MLLLLFILGLCIGSFLNVLIDRLPWGKSVVTGRSFCDHCKHKLAWYDLVPVLSFILLKRRCRYCRKEISWQYPLVELSSALLFSFSYINISIHNTNQYIDTFNYYSYIIYILVITAGLLAIFVTDFKYRIIPDEILIVQIITACAYLFFIQRSQLIGNILTGILFTLTFLFFVVITRGKGMGLGDVKFAFVMGLILGYPNIIVAFYLSFLTGALISLILIIGKQKKLKSKIAFGPFLCLATFITLFFGDILWIYLKEILGV